MAIACCCCCCYRSHFRCAGTWFMCAGDGLQLRISRQAMLSGEGLRVRSTQHSAAQPSTTQQLVYAVTVGCN